MFVPPYFLMCYTYIQQGESWATQVAGERLTNYFNGSGELDKDTEAIRKCVLVLPMGTLYIGLTGTVKFPHCLSKGLV